MVLRAPGNYNQPPVGWFNSPLNHGIITQLSNYIWSNYSDLTRPHPKWWFSKGNPLISGKSRLVKYNNLARLYTNYHVRHQVNKVITRLVFQCVTWRSCSCFENAESCGQLGVATTKKNTSYPLNASKRSYGIKQDRSVVLPPLKDDRMNFDDIFSAVMGGRKTLLFFFDFWVSNLSRRTWFSWYFVEHEWNYNDARTDFSSKTRVTYKAWGFIFPKGPTFYTRKV